MKLSRISTRLIVLTGTLVTLIVALGDLVLGVVFGVGLGIWIVRTQPRKFVAAPGQTVTIDAEPRPPSGQAERRRDTRRPPHRAHKEFDNVSQTPTTGFTALNQGTVKRIVS